MALTLAAPPPASSAWLEWLPRGVRGGGRVAAGLAGAALFAAMLAALVPPYLAVRYVDRATTTWMHDRRGAFRDLERAARVNPVSVAPHTTAGTIALALAREETARVHFLRALSVEPDWYSHFQLALIHAHEGRFDRARRRLTRASQLDARDPLITDAREEINDHRRIDPVAFSRRLFDIPLFRAERIV